MEWIKATSDNFNWDHLTIVREIASKRIVEHEWCCDSIKFNTFKYELYEWLDESKAPEEEVELKEALKEAKSYKKEIERIKKHFTNVCAENKKKYSDNTAILVFIQQMEESITWINNL